jgi:DNA-binding LacI/PurR family transcriptional regulator
MSSLLGILSVEQYPSFFAERYFREILTIASQTVAGHECYIRIMPPLPAQAEAAHAQLIAPDDHDALTLLSLLQRRGMRVPDDIALVGSDDEDFTAETFPTLTTVSQPLAEMSRRAVLYLLARLTDAERGIYQDILPNRLIVRESSGAQLGNR